MSYTKQNHCDEIKFNANQESSSLLADTEFFKIRRPVAGLNGFRSVFAFLFSSLLNNRASSFFSSVVAS